MTPDELRVSPVGRVPAERDHVYGDLPPVAARVWLYAEPAVAPGRVEVEIASGAVVVGLFRNDDTLVMSEAVRVIPLCPETPAVYLLPTSEPLPSRSGADPLVSYEPSLWHPAQY